MQKSNCPRDKWRNAVFLLVALLLLLADQASKTWIRTIWERDNLRPGQPLIDLGLFQITNIRNSGAAFGLFPDQSVILTIIAFVGIPAMLASAIFSSRYLPFLDNMPGKAAFGLILGGTIGNLIDRLRFGYVTDFIDFRIWPTFNLADSAITIGTIIVVYCLLRLGRAERH